MSPRRRPGRRLLKALLPVVLVLVLALAGLAAWLAYGAAHPPRRPYLVTPEQFARLSDRGLKATEETWPNRDGTQARGWLMRGREDGPAVVLLHRYGADRSWLLNLGVKLNETTNMTVLLPDSRGHGENPSVATTSFGALEAGDVLAAVEYLRTLKTAQGRPLVGESVGLYGVGMGAYTALAAARNDERVRSLVLDSVPDDPDAVLRTAVAGQTGIDNVALQLLARAAVHLYLYGSYRDTPACTVAETLSGRRVLLLSGADAGDLRASTETLAKCFPAGAGVETQTDLPLTGLTLAPASAEQGEAYDRRVIEFFSRTLNARQ